MQVARWPRYFASTGNFTSCRGRRAAFCTAPRLPAGRRKRNKRNGHNSMQVPCATVGALYPPQSTGHPAGRPTKKRVATKQGRPVSCAAPITPRPLQVARWPRYFATSFNEPFYVLPGTACCFLHSSSPPRGVAKKKQTQRSQFGASAVRNGRGPSTRRTPPSHPTGRPKRRGG